VLVLLPRNIEPEALKQIENTASMPFIYKHVAVMPDCHNGKGTTVGTVLAPRARSYRRGWAWISGAAWSR
jgi:RNA-splicing ligase RtcB